MSKFNALVSEKNSEYVSDMKHFKRVYLRPFLGLNVKRLLYVVNIQPKLKLHPHSSPTKYY